VPPQRLSATYFDTDDLWLARWGASLRRRSGEGWTVKLPVAADDLVRAYIRTAPLRPQARLRIVRWRTEARAAARLQDVLGEHQDAVVAERWLRVWVQRSRSAPAAFAARARWPEAWQALSTRLGGWS
jgi:hypothetical protein